MSLPVTVDLARTRFVADFDGAIAEGNKKLEQTFQQMGQEKVKAAA